MGNRKIGLMLAGAGMAGALAAGLATPAMAQADGTASGEEAIIVMGDRLEESQPRELARYGSRIEVVSGQAVDEGGYVDAAGALRNLVPGLFVTPKSGAFDYIQASLAGSRTSEVLFLVDGVRINNRLYASTAPLDTLPAGMIESIEVLKGGQGLYYGTQAVGGIVNINTRGFTRATGGALEASYDTNDGYHINGFARGSAGDHYFVGFASHDEAEGFAPFREEDVQPSALDRERGYRVTTVGGKYAYEPSDAFRLSASYQHVDARLDFAKAEDITRNWNARNEEIASLKLDWMPTDDLAVYVKGYWHDWDSTYLDERPTVNPDGSIGATFTVYDGEVWGYEDRGINLLGEYQLTDQFALVAGYDYQKYSGYDEVFLIAPSSEEVHAPFAQLKFDSGALSLAAGLRHNMPSDGEKKTVWNVSGRFGEGEGAYVRGQVGTSFRLPTAYELYVIDPCCERGNPDLVGEQSLNVEGGVGYTTRGFNAELIGFWREVEDLISISYDLPAYPDGFLVNTAGRVKVWGGEAVATYQVNDILGVTVDYVHTVAEQSGSDLQLVNIPRDQAKLIVDARAPGGRFGGGAALNWVGDLNANVAGVGRVNYGNYAVLDLSAFAFLDDDQRHRINVRLENALDADYDSSVTRVRTDVTNISYAAGFRGTPMTLHVGYRLGF
jgi:vitamin B12 transporter